MKLTEIKDYRDPSMTPPVIQKISNQDVGHYFAPTGEHTTEPVLETGSRKLRTVLVVGAFILVAAFLICLGIVV